MEISERTLSIARKRFVWKKLMRYDPSSDKKVASTQNLGSAFLNRIRKVQTSKYEPDLLKTFDCFIDDHVSVHSVDVSFVMKYKTYFKCSFCSLHF